MYRDPWSSLGDMYPDECVHCSGMGAALRWSDKGCVYVWECSCEKGTEMSGEMWQPVKEWYHRGEAAEAWIAESRFYLADIVLEPSGYIDLPDDIRLCKRVEPEAITPDALMGARFERVCETNAGESVYTREFRTSAQEVLFSVHVLLLNNGTAVRLATGRYSDSRKVRIATMQDLRTLIKFLSGDFR